MEQQTQAHEPHGRPEAVQILIDRKHYVAPKEEMTGVEIRQIPDPDIAADRDLWLEVPHGDDDRIEDNQTVHLHNGMKFYTAPKTIDPGAA